jgi:hypothetical protein
MAWGTAPTFVAGTAPIAANLNQLSTDINLIGGAWSTYTPTWTAVTTNPVLGNGTIAGRYKLIGDKTCHVQIKLTMGSTTTFGSGNYLFSLPTGTSQETSLLFPLGVGMVIDASPTNRYAYFVGINSSSTVVLWSPASPGASVTQAAPITFASGDSIYLSFTYELA